jgi:regulator of RNase E activity RraA
MSWGHRGVGSIVAGRIEEMEETTKLVGPVVTVQVAEY